MTLSSLFFFPKVGLKKDVFLPGVVEPFYVQDFCFVFLGVPVKVRSDVTSNPSSG